MTPLTADETTSTRSTTRSWTRIRGLDGLRAVAVIAVLLYHANVPWMPGGFLGVDLFFVLSGFLITSILLHELRRTGTISFGTFYTRRAKRLLPASLLVIGASILLAATLATDALSQTLRDAPAALAYVLNWKYVIGEMSYFEALGRPPLLQHLWSLSVEEQFYILWPLLMLGVWRLGGRKAILWMALIGATISSILMVGLSISGGMPVPNDGSRVYFGTDTHSSGLLIGAALACFWRPQRNRQTVPLAARAGIDLVGMASLAAIVATFVRIPEYSTALYRGGFALFAMVTALLIATVSHPASDLGRLLDSQPLRWVGERSYGIYLWHWPIFLVTRPGLDVPWTGPWVIAGQFALTFLAAELSYRFIESPIRHWKSTAKGSQTPLAKGGRGLLLVGLVGALVATATLSLSAARAKHGDEASAGNGIAQPLPPTSTPPRPSLTPSGPASSSPIPSSPRPSNSAKPSASKSASPTSKPSASETPSFAPIPGRDYAKEAVWAYGDSVILGASHAIRDIYPNLWVDAEVSRHIWIVHDHIAQNIAQLNDRLVIVHTGNNGWLDERSLRNMLDTLKVVHRVVLINQSMPRRWESPNNKLFNKVAPDYPNVRLADWKAESEGHGDWFGADGVHTNDKGARAYARMVKRVAEAP